MVVTRGKKLSSSVSDHVGWGKQKDARYMSLYVSVCNVGCTGLFLLTYLSIRVSRDPLCRKDSGLASSCLVISIDMLELFPPFRMK